MTPNNFVDVHAIDVEAEAITEADESAPSETPAVEVSSEAASEKTPPETTALDDEQSSEAEQSEDVLASDESSSTETHTPEVVPSEEPHSETPPSEPPAEESQIIEVVAEDVSENSRRIKELNEALELSQQRNGQLEKQVTVFKTEIDELQTRVQQLQFQLAKVNQLEKDLEEAKRYIRELTQVSARAESTTNSATEAVTKPQEASVDSPEEKKPTPAPQAEPPAAAPAQTQPKSSHGRSSLAPVKRPVSPQALPRMSTEQLNGLPKMSTEQIVRSPSSKASSRVEKAKRVSDADLPKPKLSDKEIGWFD